MGRKAKGLDESEGPLDDERRALVASCYPMAWRMAYDAARRGRGRGLDPEECYDAAINGLVRASRSYDPSLGFKFTTYAHGGIRLTVAAAPKAVAARRRAVNFTDLPRLIDDRGDGDDRARRLPYDPAAPEHGDCGPSELPPAVRGEVTPREWELLVLLFAEGLTEAEAAEKMGVSRQRVQQLLDAATARLRRAAAEGRIGRGLSDG